MKELTNVQKQQAHLLNKLTDIYSDVMGDGYGNLHIVLADNNYDDGSALVCFRFCVERGDYIGQLICELLNEFTEEQREYILEDVNKEGDYIHDCYELDIETYRKTLRKG